MNRPLPPPAEAAATGRPTLADSTLFIERALVGDAWIAADLSAEEAEDAGLLASLEVRLLFPGCLFVASFLCGR